MPLAHPATSDPNVYDRTWFNGYSTDGQAYFGIGMAVYPHRRVQDAAFSVVTADGRQYAFFGSRLAPLERTDMAVGPFRIEIDEPMRRTRVILDDNASGLACDLTFSTRTAPVQEARQTLTDGLRIVMDASRFDQFGRWTGTVRYPDGELAVDEDGWRGTKDRSWGVRGVGEPMAVGPPRPRTAFFLWAPLFWDDVSAGPDPQGVGHASHAIFFDDARGQPLVREGLTAPLFATEADVPEAPEGIDTRMATARHRVTYHPGTRLAASAEIDLVPIDGPIRTITLDPVLRFHMKGLAYGHPTWRQGSWLGELELGAETYDLADLDLLRPENIHVQQVVRASDDQGRSGIGVLEQVVFGPYAPAGFTGVLDGAGRSGPG